MKVKQPQFEIKVVQMDKHFLYLPFYYAKKHNFFGLLPSNYTIVIDDLPKFNHTDENAYKRLMEEPDKKNQVHLAICDPIVVFDEKYKPHDASPAILGAMVTNSAFWAIDHDTHKTVCFKDLGAYDRIISYQAGTTSYKIAERLHQVSGKTCSKEDFISQVQPNYEIITLNASQSGTIALSPNPFEIAELVSNSDGKYKINLALGDTPEYNNVLVTALLSRRDFVEKHPAFVQSLITALQRAMLLIRHYDETHESKSSVVGFAEEYFTEGKNAANALKMALQSQVFPSNLEITKGQWLNAIRANHFQLSETEADKLALSAFESYIAPYLYFAKEAAKTVIPPSIFPKDEKPKNILFNKSNIIFCSIIVAISIFGSYFLGLTKIFPIPLAVIIAYIISYSFRLFEDKKRNAIHITIFTVATAYSLALLNFNISNLVNAGVFLTLLSAEFSTINASFKSNK